MRAAIEATAAQDGDKWHEAASVAVEHGLRLVVAAARLRDETGYRWRFGFDQDRADTAEAAATEALGPQLARAAAAEGAALDWRDAAASRVGPAASVNDQAMGGPL